MLGQLARLSFPIGIGPQGVLIEEGYDAVRVSGSGELPPSGNGPVESIDEDKLGALGRATLRTVSALDRGPRPEHGPETYVTAVSQVLPGWVLALLGGTLLLPALVAAVDALARARRQRIEVVAWLRWVAAWVAPFLAGLAAAELLALTGATPAPPPAPVPPDVLPLDGAAVAVLAGVLVAMALALLLARHLAARPDPRLARPEGSGAAVAVALTASGGALALWLANPYAGLLAVPAAHLWLLALLARPQPKRRVRALLLGLGALPAALVAVYYLFALSIDPLSGAWYLLLLLTGHSVGLLTALVGCVMIGALCAAGELVGRSPAAPAEATRAERAARVRARVPCRAGLARRHGVGATQVVQRAHPVLVAGPARADRGQAGRARGTFSDDEHFEQGRARAADRAGRVRGRRPRGRRGDAAARGAGGLSRARSPAGPPPDARRRRAGRGRGRRRRRLARSPAPRPRRPRAGPARS